MLLLIYFYDTFIFGFVLVYYIMLYLLSISIFILFSILTISYCFLINEAPCLFLGTFFQFLLYCGFDRIRDVVGFAPLLYATFCDWFRGCHYLPLQWWTIESSALD